MPKRACPFAESNRPQLKNRIGIKEVNMGVMMKENMKLVYDKTLTMMYQASKALSKDNSSIKASKVSFNESLEAPRVLPGQRKLNFSGQLDGIYTEQDEPMAISNHQFVPISCSSCGNMPSFSRVCHFCERCLCEYCSRDCYRCQYSYCGSCATLKYDEGDDVCICYSCV